MEMPAEESSLPPEPGACPGAEQPGAPARTGGGGKAAPATVPTLRTALRTARIEEAERSRAIADVRGAEIARLEMLRDALEPVLAQIPDGVDLFDAGLIPGPQPRLFIDMVAFVEMGHDKRLYRFVQDTRQGRVVLAESERLETIGAAVTAYIARRLIEREKALTSRAEAALPRRPLLLGTSWDWLPAAGELLLRYLGIAALCVLAWVLGWTVYQHWVGRP